MYALWLAGLGLDGAEKPETALAAIRLLERDASVLGGSPHLLVAGHTPR